MISQKKYFFQPHSKACMAAEILLIITIGISMHIARLFYELPQAAAGVLWAGGIFLCFFTGYVVFLEWCRRKLLAKTISAAQATNYFMWWTMGKLFASMVILFIYIRLSSHLMPFLPVFAALYVEFLLYEVLSVRELNKIDVNAK
jgi:hypothetical protein